MQGAVDLDQCESFTPSAQSPTSMRFDGFDESKVSMFYHLPDGRWIQALEGMRSAPETAHYLEVLRADVLERAIECGVWPIPADLLPDAPQASLSDPREEAANPPVPSRENTPGALPVPARVLAAAHVLVREGKKVTITAACARANVNRSWYSKHYREHAQMIKNLACGGLPTSVSKPDGSSDSWNDE